MSKGEVHHFSASGGARELVETCINDLRVLSSHVREGDEPEKKYMRARRAAVIILYASGEVGVTEGWNLDGDDFSNSYLLEKASGE